ARPDRVSRGRVYLNVVVLPRNRGYGRVQPALEVRRVCDRVQQGARALVDRHPPAGALGQLQAVAGERVPAQDREPPGGFERSVSDGLERGGEHVALLV